jgi:hypothetical protein
MVVEVNADEMLVVGLNCMGFVPERIMRHSDNTKMSHFECAFGVNANISCMVFHDIQTRDVGEYQIRKPKVAHFLLALHCLKRYPIEQLSSGIFGYHEDTVRKWVWKYCSAIQALKPYKVSFFQNCLHHCLS